MRNFIKHYRWFWKESFDFMQGHNKLYITWGCIIKSIPYAISMCRWDKMTPNQKEDWYLTTDRSMYL